MLIPERVTRTSDVLVLSPTLFFSSALSRPKLPILIRQVKGKFKSLDKSHMMIQHSIPQEPSLKQFLQNHFILHLCWFTVHITQTYSTPVSIFLFSPPCIELLS